MTITPTLRQLTAAVLATGLVGTAATAQESILFGTYVSDTTQLNIAGFHPYVDALNESGEFDVSSLTDGAVVSARTTLSGLADGIVDLTYIPAVYYPAELPVTNVFVNLGATMSNVPAAIGAIIEVSKLDCPQCEAEGEKMNFVDLGSWSLTPYRLLCSNPVETAEDVKGLRIRAAGHTIAIVNAMGATPTNVPSSEVYEVVQRGQVDCVFAPIAWLDEYALGELVHNVTMVSAGTIPSAAAFAFRRDKFDDLSPEQRKVLLDAAPMAVAGALFGTQGSDVSALERDGVTFNVTEASADLQAVIDEAVQAQVAGAVETANAAGVEDAQGLVDKYLAAYARWEGLVEGVDTPEAYAQLLRDEIYSKIEMK
ncbi:hypothetical protein [Arenibacterium halophilum]|uniref:TRAP-type C4-dicarboxylate transport system, substrate-binding protein n=1 Tax=Arenibacterium halophilum TaxID=2583821 RepID=A0ABY2XD39_9RHOB|nr:hypothetical protein [Arenibacterium halophilum]TMV14611.1 hypothetical protein FGK64_01085 [Arenibacterium halophilum]